MQGLIDQRIEEIKLCFQNDDINRTSQRLLDLVYDFDFGESARKSALKIRKNYNKSKELGRVKIENKALHQELNILLEEIKNQQPAIPEEVGQKKILARFSNISKQFKSRLHNFNFKPISLDLIQGKIIGLVGENGNGKTTLLRMLSGELSADSGHIEYYLNEMPIRDWQFIKKKIAFIPQRLERWYGTAEENISFHAANKGFKGEKNKEKVDFIIGRMGLTNFRELSWPEISSGYKLRIEIAMALVWEPEILILDEPLANLDIQAQELLLQDLRNLADSIRNPASIILSSQQLHEVETIADQVIFLKNGNAVFNGNLKDFKNMETSLTFEVNGNFSYLDLQELLFNWEEIKIEQSASSFTISCSGNHSKEEFLKLLANNNIDINYFRNISGSTKKLFNDKY
ncbi:MAG: ABC transporter ATP-binding protein [Bacteroidetes bacterium]|nr:ABC transporter ATP-binding protein [Bacteroidota bacterium]